MKMSQQYSTTVEMLSPEKQKIIECFLENKYEYFPHANLDAVYQCSGFSMEHFADLIWEMWQKDQVLYLTSGRYNPYSHMAPKKGPGSWNRIQIELFEQLRNKHPRKQSIEYLTFWPRYLVIRKEYLPLTRKYYVIVEDPGASYFTSGSMVPLEEFEEERKKVLDRGEKLPTIRIRIEESGGNGNGDKHMPATEPIEWKSVDAKAKELNRLLRQVYPGTEDWTDVNLSELIDQTEKAGLPVESFIRQYVGTLDPRKYREFIGFGKTIIDPMKFEKEIDDQILYLKNKIGSQTKEPTLDYLPDTPEFLTYTIENSGQRTALDEAFAEAIARVKEK